MYIAANTYEPLRKMVARFGRNTWSLVMPDGWRAWHDDECATLVVPGEIDAFEISAFPGNLPVIPTQRQISDSGACPSPIALRQRSISVTRRLTPRSRPPVSWPDEPLGSRH